MIRGVYLRGVDGIIDKGAAAQGFHHGHLHHQGVDGFLHNHLHGRNVVFFRQDGQRAAGKLVLVCSTASQDLLLKGQCSPLHPVFIGDAGFIGHRGGNTAPILELVPLSAGVLSVAGIIIPLIVAVQSHGLEVSHEGAVANLGRQNHGSVGSGLPALHVQVHFYMNHGAVFFQHYILGALCLHHADGCGKKESKGNESSHIR